MGSNNLANQEGYIYLTSVSLPVCLGIDDIAMLIDILWYERVSTDGIDSNCSLYLIISSIIIVVQMKNVKRIFPISLV